MAKAGDAGRFKRLSGRPCDGPACHATRGTRRRCTTPARPPCPQPWTHHRTTWIPTCKALQVGLCPSTKPHQDGPQRRTAFGKLECVVARHGLRAAACDQVQAAEQLEPVRQDVGRDVFGRREKLRVRAGSVDDQVPNDQHRPLVPERVEGGVDGACRTPVDLFGVGCHCVTPRLRQAALAAAICLNEASMGVDVHSITSNLLSGRKAWRRPVPFGTSRRGWRRARRAIESSRPLRYPTAATRQHNAVRCIRRYASTEHAQSR
jgi:hypothetical protein